MLEFLSRDVDPGERVEMYPAASRWFWEEGMRLLAAGDVRQANFRVAEPSGLRRLNPATAREKRVREGYVVWMTSCA